MTIAFSVDWASLAKQWIAQREAAQTFDHGTLAQPPPPPPPPPPVEQEILPAVSQPSSQEDENSMDISDEEEGSRSANSLSGGRVAFFTKQLRIVSFNCSF